MRSVTSYFIGVLAPVKAFDKLIPEEYAPIPLEQRHLTLVYLGKLNEIEGMVGLLESVKPQLRVFRMTFRGLAPFPSYTRPRYLAALPVRESSDLLKQVRSVILDKASFEIHDRYSDFKPHVSIAYTKVKPTLSLLRKLEAVIKRSMRVREEITVSSVSLFKAERGIIEEIHRIELSL